jgi:hypothetical protein
MTGNPLHAMIDLETLDTETSAVVLSVGMVVYDPLTIVRSDLSRLHKLYYSLDIQPQLEQGRTIGGDTVVWWSKQSTEARQVFTEYPKTHPIGVLSNIYDMLREYRIQHVWGNGVDFDNAIITSLAKSFGAPKPLNYKHNRCFRTLKALLGHHIPAHATMPIGTHHNALDDAVYQAVQHGYMHRAYTNAAFPDVQDLIESVL